MDFTEILDSYGIPYLTEGNHHCRPGWVQIDCPFCGPNSGKFHMGYKIQGGYMSCWKCRGHSAVSTLAEITGESFTKIKAMLSGVEGIDTRRAEEVSKRGKLVMPKPLTELKRVHRDYLRERGFNPRELVELWKLQGLDLRGHLVTPEKKVKKLAWRVFIPFILGGKIVSWTTRSVQPDAALRYVNAPAECEALSLKNILYGEDYCTHACCAVEGPADVWGGGPGFVALAGTSYTRAQVLRLARYNVRGICFDNEPKAQQQARELVDELSAFPGETYNIVLDEKDPGEASKKEINRIRRTLGL